MKTKKSKVLEHANFKFTVDNHIPIVDIKSHPKLNRFISLAKSMSEISIFNKFRIGAVLVMRGKVIARGYNSTKGHPLQKKYNELRVDMGENSHHPIHAEMDVLKQLKSVDLRGAEMYIYNLNTQGEQRMARPCAACMAAIKKHGIGIIHYSTPEGFATEYIDPKQKIIVKKGKRPI